MRLRNGNTIPTAKDGYPFRDDCWFNARTGEELADEVFVEGWKPWVGRERDHG